MAYSSQTDLEDRLTESELRQLADFNGDGVADSDVLARAISDADALIDSYIGTRYSVPLDDVPDSIRLRSINIALYFLYLGRQSVTDSVSKQHDHDLKWLQSIAAGSVSLGIAETPDAADGAPSVEYEVEDQHFGRDSGL